MVQNRPGRSYLYDMRTFYLPLIALALLSGDLFASAPNLLVIQTDEHNFRTLGCYRDTLPPEQAFIWGKDAFVETPNIDWLAKNGALCTSFYATTPVCSPSRAALISGMYPHKTPVNTNNISLSDDVITFAELLKREGHRTGYIGKWHLDGGGKPQWAPKRKFGFEDNRFMFNRGHWKKFIDTPEGPAVGAKNKDGQPSYSLDGADEKTFATDWLSNKTIDFIKADPKTPFCLMVAIPDPHGPNSVRAPYDTMYNDMKIEMPRTMTIPGEEQPFWGKAMVNTLQQQSMAKYFGMVKCIDDNFGNILDALRETGQLENTMIVFTSDHGDLCGEHCRHNKGVPYEASAKVPFIMYYPPAVKAGIVIDEAMSCVDFLPTSFALLGYKTAGKEAGRDASAFFKTGTAPKGWNDMAFLRSTGDRTAASAWLCAVSDRYKLVISRTEDPWLFDLEKDPDETTNFAQRPKHRKLIRDYSTQLMAYAKAQDDPFLHVDAIKQDIEWGMGDEAAYTSTRVKADAAQKKTRRDKKKK